MTTAMRPGSSGTRQPDGKAFWKDASTRVRSRRGTPCPICTNTDWCCMAADGSEALCMRVESSRTVKTQTGTGWLHKIEGERREYEQPKKKQKPKVEDWTAEAKKRWEHPSAAQARERLAMALGVDETALNEMRIGWGWDEWRNVEFTTWPERDEAGRVVGIVRRYWQPVKVRKGDPPEDAKDKLTMSGSSHGLYYRRAWRDGKGPIFVPEGGSDTAAMLSMGLRAIGRPSCTGGAWQLSAMLRSTTEPVVVLGEWDEKPEKRGQRRTRTTCPASCSGCMICWPGMAGAQTTAQQLQHSLQRRIYWCLITGAKDIRDWCRVFGQDAERFINMTRDAVRTRR